MQQDQLLPFRYAAAFVCLILLAGGALLLKNFDRIVPAKTTASGENDSQRTYAAFLIFAVWAHAFALSASFAIFLS